MTRLSGIKGNKNVAEAVVDVYYDNVFDTVDASVELNSIDPEDFEELIKEMAKLLRRYNINVVRK